MFHLGEKVRGKKKVISKCINMYALCDYSHVNTHTYKAKLEGM